MRKYDTEAEKGHIFREALKFRLLCCQQSNFRKPLAKSLSLTIGQSKQEVATASSCLLVATPMIALQQLILGYLDANKNYNKTLKFSAVWK